MWLDKNQTKEKFLFNTIPAKKKHTARNIVLAGGALIFLGSLMSVIWVQMQQTTIKENAAKAQTLFSKNSTEALVLAIHTAGQNDRLTKILPWTKILTSVQLSLRQAIDVSKESHLFQHDESVHSVAFNPKDKKVIMSSDGNGINFWSKEGKPISQILPNQNINLVIYSPNGQTIAVVIDHRIIRLLDREGKYLETFRDKKGEIISLAFSPNGKYLVSGNQDTTLRLWDLEGNLILTLRGHERKVDSVMFSPDSNYILSGSHEDGSVRLWDLNGQQLQAVSIGKNLLTALTFSPDGETIIIGGRDGKIRLWNINEHRVQTLSGHKKSVSSVAYNPDGQTFVSSSLDNTIHLWAKDGSLLQTLQGHEEEVKSVAFSADGKQIISGSKDGTVRLWIGGNWQDWLSEGCNQLKNDPVLADPQTKAAKGAKQTCQQYIVKDESVAQSKDQPANSDSSGSKTPEVTKNPEVTQASEVAKTPEVKTNSEVTKTPEVTKAPEATETPEETKAPEITPEDFQPTAKALAKHYHHRGSDPAEIKLIEKFNQVINNPATSKVDKTNAYINRGVIYFRDQKYEPAIESYTKAINTASDRQMVQIYVNRGIAYLSLHEPKYELAIQDLNQAINIDPKYFDAYVERGIAFASLGQYDRAIENYNQAIEINPDNPDVHYAQGFTLALEKDKQQEAIEAYRQAAKLYEQQGKKDYAQSALTKIEELQK